MLRNTTIRSIVRPFSTSRAVFNDPLYKTPAKWIGLPPEQILDLHKQRRYNLGPKYKKSQEELDALLTTAEATATKPNDIKRIYWEGEAAYAEITNNPLKGLLITPEGSLKQTFDEYPLLARLKINQHRIRREYNRVAAYEMPHLVKYRQEYKPDPTKKITLKYISILGEEDTAITKKVVLTVKTQDLGLGAKELHKLKLLAGSRYDDRIDEIKIATNRFPESLQNTRYLLDTLKRLVEESKDLTETFEDIPLDRRHLFGREKRANKKNHIRNLQFPEEWKRPQDAPVKVKTVVDYVKERQQSREF